MLINHASKQVAAKIVYYGPGLSGKTTNLQYIFSVTNPKSRGELVSMETEVERTLFFDLLPINVGVVNGYEIRFQLYTVPGQVFYAATRKLVLKASDGVVFVADSQELMESSNVESFENLKENLQFYKTSIEKIPLVFQYNKRDLRNLSSVERLNELLNPHQAPFFEASAKEGRGVLETLREVSTLTLTKITEILDHETKHKHVKQVRYDTNSGQEIIEKDKLPYKKISVESFSSSQAEIHVPLMSIETDESTDASKKPAHEEPVPIEQPVTIIQLQDESTAETMPLDDIAVDIPAIDDSANLTPEAVAIPVNEVAPDPPVPSQEAEVTPVSLPEPAVAVAEVLSAEPAVADTPVAVMSEAIEPASEEKKEIKKDPTGFLSQFEDTTRITKIEKIKVSDPEIHVEIKDKHGVILKKMIVKLYDDTKKVNVILDVKK